MIGPAALTILEGSTFCVSDEAGDVYAATHGFFASDTRFLSRLRLTVNGEPPLRLSGGRVEYFSAALFMRNPVGRGLAPDELLVRRERFVASGLHEHVVLSNLTDRPLEIELGLAVANDFADIISVKESDFSFGDPAHARPLPPPRYPEARDETGMQLAIRDERGELETTIVLSVPPLLGADGVLGFRVRLEPHGEWDVRVEVAPSTAEAEPALPYHFGEERRRVRESLDAWHLRAPHLATSWEPLERTYYRSVADLAALRMHALPELGQLPAAGMPWFMTVFGRDTIITSLETLLLGPELAISGLEALAVLQATVDDPTIDAEPGKIVHELRAGRAAETWFARYYGTVDATPLYLVLLSEVWRWTGDDALVERFWPSALAALGWIDGPGDRDGDGFVEYERRTPRGLVNQSWKDSTDSQRFHDGRLAEAPIAPCEVQGYVYDAKRRLAELARAVAHDEQLAVRLDADAAALAQQFDERYWIADRGFYALALDRDKQPVDSLTSNIGHLLFSGIVPPERVAAVTARLFSEDLWSGWGVRTMSTRDAGYSPLAYHNGTVWPHDNALIAWGLARYGRVAEAQEIARRMFGAAGYFGDALPEVFAGLSARDTPFPVAYPTASHPQAWAAGAPLLLLRVLLGLEPDREQRTLTAYDGEIPDDFGELRLGGVPAFGERFDIEAVAGRVRSRSRRR